MTTKKIGRYATLHEFMAANARGEIQAGAGVTEWTGTGEVTIETVAPVLVHVPWWRTRPALERARYAAVTNAHEFERVVAA